MEFQDILNKSDLFAGADKDAIDAVAQCGTTRSFAAGSSIFREGDTGTEFYIVVRGSVAINKNIAGGRKRNLSNLSRGEIFGELALFDSEPRSADAEAIEKCEVMVFDNRRFLALLSENLPLAYLVHERIIRTLCKRLRATDDMLKEGVIWGFSMDI